MSTYVINNRIPRFPIRPHYFDHAGLLRRLEEIFQIWLRERFISNLTRRKTCSQLYDFSVWMSDQKRLVETSQAEHFTLWCLQQGIKPLSDWGDFLMYARNRVPELEWNSTGSTGSMEAA